MRILAKRALRKSRIASPIAVSPIGAAASSSWALIASSSARCSASQDLPASVMVKRRLGPVRGRGDEAGFGQHLQDRIDGAGTRAIGSLEPGLQASNDVVAVTRLLGDEAQNNEPERARIEHPRPAPALERAAAMAAEEPAKGRGSAFGVYCVARRSRAEGRTHGPVTFKCAIQTRLFKCLGAGFCYFRGAPLTAVGDRLTNRRRPQSLLKSKSCFRCFGKKMAIFQKWLFVSGLVRDAPAKSRGRNAHDLGSSGFCGALRFAMKLSNACLSCASRCLRSNSSKALASSSSCLSVA